MALALSGVRGGEVVHGLNNYQGARTTLYEAAPFQNKALPPGAFESKGDVCLREKKGRPCWEDLEEIN